MAHRVVVQRDGYETAETTALVETGEERRVDVPLAQRSSVFGRWWSAGTTTQAGKVAMTAKAAAQRSAAGHRSRADRHDLGRAGQA